MQRITPHVFQKGDKCPIIGEPGSQVGRIFFYLSFATANNKQLRIGIPKPKLFGFTFKTMI